MTTNSPSRILQQFMIADGLFTDPVDMADFPLFKSHMPDKPDDAGTVYDTAGVKDGRLLTDGFVIIHYGFQVRVRSKDHDEGWVKISAVEKRMETVVGSTVVIAPLTYTLQNISQSGSVLSLGREKNTQRRNLFTVNFLATIKEE